MAGVPHQSTAIEAVHPNPRRPAASQKSGQFHGGDPCTCQHGRRPSVGKQECRLRSESCVRRNAAPHAHCERGKAPKPSKFNDGAAYSVGNFLRHLVLVQKVECSNFQFPSWTIDRKSEAPINAAIKTRSVEEPTMNPRSRSDYYHCTAVEYATRRRGHRIVHVRYEEKIAAVFRRKRRRILTAVYCSARVFAHMGRADPAFACCLDNRPLKSPH